MIYVSQKSELVSFLWNLRSRPSMVSDRSRSRSTRTARAGWRKRY